MRVKVEFYNLGLFKFVNDSVIFDNETLYKINKSIKEFLENNSREKVTDYERWDFHVFKFKDCCEKIPMKDWLKINEMEFGYYHHRFFFHLTFEIDKKDIFKNLREKRKDFKDYSDSLMNILMNEINKYVENEKQIIYFYSYLFIIVKGYKIKEIPEVSTTVEFEIISPYRKFSFLQPIYHIRISIPSIILYSPRKGSEKNMKFLIRNITNNIYQDLLYRKKLADIENKKRNPYHSYTNLVEEIHLLEMWEKMLDYLGGKSTDFNLIRLTRWMIFLSILIIILTGITLSPYVIDLIKMFLQYL